MPAIGGPIIAYQAPVEDLAFAFFDLVDVPAILADTFDEDLVSRSFVPAVFAEIAKICEEQLAPLNRVGDEEGCRLVDGAVTVPPGFAAAFRAIAEGGWIGIDVPADHGGQGLPGVMSLMMHEMMMAANLSFADYVGLPQAAAKTLLAHAGEDIRDMYVSALAEGRACATMCMTEPQCGTDLGLIRTTARENGDGSYALDGTKIFISAGDHDLTDDILHLVLARREGAPAGVRGLSLFACPKRVEGESGALVANAVSPVRLERKMGYKAAATCEMQFDGARAWLIGEPERGLPAMFTMVNTARLLVAIQGVSCADGAYQMARDYARERLQGRALSGPVNPDGPADPLIAYPDVRRMLLATRSFIEAARAMTIWLGALLDRATAGPQDDAAQNADDLVALLTPVVKAGFSDLGFRSVNDCMQIFGGHGYIRDTGVEQFVRDCRIAQIQEGANAIQALDLIGRKLVRNDSRAWKSFAAKLEHTRAALAQDPQFADFEDAFSRAFTDLSETTETLLSRIADDPERIGAAGVDYQHGFALVCLGWVWAKTALVLADRPDDDPVKTDKMHLARYFIARELPMAHAHFARARLDASTLMAMPAENF